MPRPTTRTTSKKAANKPGQARNNDASRAGPSKPPTPAPSKQPARKAAPKPSKPSASQPAVGLAIGQIAPDFTLSDQSGARVTLSDLRGRPVVLFFYPKDATPTCTEEACAFQSGLARFARAGVKVLGISILNQKSKQKFAAKHGLALPLLADDAIGPDDKPDPKVARSYGVWIQKSMYGKPYMGIERTTFLIDSSGRIAEVWDKRTIESDVEAHVQGVLGSAKALG